MIQRRTTHIMCHTFEPYHQRTFILQLKSVGEHESRLLATLQHANRRELLEKRVQRFFNVLLTVPFDGGSTAE